MIDKETFNKDEIISGTIKCDGIKDGEYKINVILTKVYDWFDEKISVIGKCNIINSSLHFEINNNFDKGLYTIIKIADVNGTFSIGKEVNEYILGAFKVMGNNSNSIELFKKIYTRREMNFSKEKTLSNSKDAKIYDVLLFSKNIMVKTIAQYDDVQIIPYEYLGCKSEISYINNFIKNNTELGLAFKKEKFDSSIPCCVFFVKNIKASSYEDAENYALKKADLLNSIYSMLLKSHGHFFAIVTMNEDEKMAKLNIFNTRYKGNLLLYADQGHNVLHYYKELSKKNSYINVYIKLLNEAIDEENRMMKYYRYWNILEGISEHNKLENNDMKNWLGNDIKNTKNKVIKVGNQSLDKVFELIRINYSNKTEIELLGDIEGITKVKEFLSICYQRRCCCAHNGENCRNDSKVCVSIPELRCLKYNIIHKDEPLGFQDRILRRLEELVIDVLRIEIIKETGPSSKIDEYVIKSIE